MFSSNTTVCFTNTCIILTGQTNMVDMAHVDLTDATAEKRVEPEGIYQLYIHSIEFNNSSNTPPVDLVCLTFPPVAQAEISVPTAASVMVTAAESNKSTGSEEQEVVFNVIEGSAELSDDENHQHTEDYINV